MVKATGKGWLKRKNGEHVIALLVATCGFRISEALGLQWRDILWEKDCVRIRQTYAHSIVQEGAKTRLGGEFVLRDFTCIYWRRLLFLLAANRLESPSEWLTHHAGKV